MTTAAAHGGAQQIPRPADHEPGRPAPWAHLDPVQRDPDLATVVARVAAFGPPLRQQEGSGARASAVLAALYPVDDKPYVVLTRRAQHLRSHRGEVSFPGGAREGAESLVEAALREAQEEVGLDPTTVEIIGQLDPLTTFSSRSAITPFVGLLPTRPVLHPAPAEVDHILHVPLAELLLPEVFREERWRMPSTYRPIWFFELVGDTIWGATARMLRQLLAIATGVDSRDTTDAF